MIDLNRIGGGVKLINYILNKNQNKQWSKEAFSKIVEKQPNPYTTKTPPSK